MKTAATLSRLTAGHWSRRELLLRCGAGFGGLALIHLLAEAGFAVGDVEPTSRDSLAARASHFPARAKHVIHLFMGGGPSHIDTFDPKPALAERSGKPLPGFESLGLGQGGTSPVLFPSPFRFEKHGESGLEISEVFPQLAEQADKLCVIRSMHCDIPGHEQATLLLHCGDNVQARPSLGSWVTYGLGSENRNLPAFVA